MAAHKNLDDKTIIEMYLNGASTTEIGKALGTTHRTIILRLKKNNISRRTLSESQWNYKNKEMPDDFNSYETMYQKYIVEGKSKKDLGIIYNCDPCVIDRVLKELGIEVRNNSESKVGLMVGSTHPNWKGGISQLTPRVRQYLTDQHINGKVLKRDNYKCTICGGKNQLHVHHIIHFKTIMDRILNEHPDLNPIDNCDELYQIAIADKEINNTNNLITVCSECHHKIHGKWAENKPFELLEP